MHADRRSHTVLRPGHSGHCRAWNKGLNSDELDCFLKALPAQQVGCTPITAFGSISSIAWTVTPLVVVSLQDAIQNLRPGTIIELEKGAVWLGNPFLATNTLFVREVYPELILARDAYIRALGWSDSSCETIFTGTPGTCQGACNQTLHREPAVSSALRKDCACAGVGNHTLVRSSQHRSCWRAGTFCSSARIVPHPSA